MKGMKIAAITVLAVLAAGMLVFMGGLIVTGQRGGGFMIGSTPVLKAEEEAELEGISEITISSGADDIRFLESPTEKMIIKQYRAGRSDDFEPYVITKKGTELKIYNDWKQKVFSFHFFGGDWGYVEVYLPAGYPEQKLKQLEVTSSSGDIEADAGLSVLGSLSVTSSSGDIQVGNIVCGEEMAASASSGEIAIGTVTGNEAVSFSTASGDIELGTVIGSGEVTFSTSSGSSSVNRVTAAELTAKAGSGEIKIDQAAAAKAAKLVTSSGDIKAAFSGLPAVLSVESTSGGSRITVPREESFQFKATTSSGDIKVSAGRA